MVDDSAEELSPGMTGKKRIRATQACVMCRRKKIKCDGHKPNCLHCQEANLTCQYSESRKRGPRKGYVQLLEERLAQLEKKLTNDDNGRDADSDGDESTAAGSRPSQMEISSVEEYGSVRHMALRGSDVVDDDDFYPPLTLVMHLVDLFFQHLNSVFPLVHRKTLKQSIADGTVSKPLLWSVMGVGARFSDNPNIKADPPYWASERFALKATSMVDANLLEPTIPNLQFWGIMACLEYGRSSGSKAWIYGGIAVRICQELGLNKEETLSRPIMRKDGSVDTAAMALRRRIFWSCFSLDKFASAGTTRPQYFDAAECDANPPSVSESILLRDLYQCTSVTGEEVVNDSLMDITRHYVKMVMLFGEVNKLMLHAKVDMGARSWPPLAEFGLLNNRLRTWKDGLPDRFQFSTTNLNNHKFSASKNYLTLWLSAHATWCTTMLVLHRGSLAYYDTTSFDMEADTSRQIQTSISVCKDCIDEAMIVFHALKEFSGCNVLPYMGYNAYVCAAVLMTSAFSKDAESYKKSSRGLAILYNMIDGLRPYWPMCERLVLTTRDLLATHARLYSRKFGLTSPVQIIDSSSLPSPAVSAAASAVIMPSMLTQPLLSPIHNSTDSSAISFLAETCSTVPAGIDFNSSDFLHDSALFGQIIFDESRAGGEDGTGHAPFLGSGIFVGSSFISENQNGMGSTGSSSKLMQCTLPTDGACLER